MLNKINISKIILDHLKTMCDPKTGKPFWGDIFLFFIIPAIFGIILLLFHYSIGVEIINLLVTSLSVFAALLFNLLLLIYDIVRKNDITDKNRLKNAFLKEIFTNISFCIFIAIVTIILLLLAYLKINFQWLLNSVYFLICYLLTLFLLTLFMILKRVHILLSKEFD